MLSYREEINLHGKCKRSRASWAAIWSKRSATRMWRWPWPRVGQRTWMSTITGIACSIIKTDGVFGEISQNFIFSLSLVLSYSKILFCASFYATYTTFEWITINCFSIIRVPFKSTFGCTAIVLKSFWGRREHRGWQDCVPGNLEFIINVS